MFLIFNSEDDFQAYFINNFRTVYFGDCLFAKITKIAGEFIQPEIDLLDITQLQPHQNISAWEFKVLKSNIMGNNYSSIYAGIGQALAYFKYGIDQIYLVIGISNNIPEENARNIRGNLRLIGRFVDQLHTPPNRFQIKLFDESQNQV